MIDANVKKIEPEVLWMVWNPQQGFMLEVATTRTAVIDAIEKLTSMRWAILRKLGWKAMKVIVTPFSWDVMIEARKTQGVE